ncbi:MAG: glycosyltransferase, partial [Candidatus Roizmanbacteria bacterium]|nr:glycosyltransferase [Candidatus Roizmanbacteria bacterium]
KTKLKVLYHIPYPKTVYAGRFIYEGYKAAFKKSGHVFETLTSNHNLSVVLDRFKPNIFMSSLHIYYLKDLNLELLKKYRKNGLFYLNIIPAWNKHSEQYGVDDLKSNTKLVRLISSGLAGDAFYNWLEEDSEFMDGFEKVTKKPFHTILLAADTSKYFYDYDKKYKSDISYVGHYLKEKRDFFIRNIFPLQRKHLVKLYGLDWTFKDRLLGDMQRVGQFFNIEMLKGLRQLPMTIDRKVYSSSIINLNIHGDFQVKYGSDINERTYKILASGGFQICDNVKVLRKYFNKNELVIGENDKDYLEKIEYYLKYPNKRDVIIRNGQKKVLKYHTYTNRMQQIIDIYKQYISGNLSKFI